MIRFIILIVFLVYGFNNLIAQDTIILRYSFRSKYNVKGFSLNKAKKQKSYVIGKDMFGRKRIEGRLNTDGYPYSGRKIRYYKNGKIKSIETYREQAIKYKSIKVGKWQYFDNKGNLIKEENYE